MATGCARLIKRPSAMPYSPPLAHAPSGTAAAATAAAAGTSGVDAGAGARAPAAATDGARWRKLLSCFASLSGSKEPRGVWKPSTDARAAKKMARIMVACEGVGGGAVRGPVGV